MPAEPPADNEVLLEFHRIGHMVRVSAIDPATGIEAVVSGPASAGEAQLKATAVAKLRWLLRRRAGPGPDGPAGAAPGGRGLIV